MTIAMDEPTTIVNASSPSTATSSSTTNSVKSVQPFDLPATTVIDVPERKSVSEKTKAPIKKLNYRYNKSNCLLPLYKSLIKE